MPLGSAVVTSAGSLPYRGIIHVAGINNGLSGQALFLAWLGELTGEARYVELGGAVEPFVERSYTTSRLLMP